MDGSMPTPHRISSPIAHSTYAAAVASPPARQRVLGVVEDARRRPRASLHGRDERRDRAVAGALQRARHAAVDEVDLEGVRPVLDAGPPRAAQREPAPRRERAARLDRQVLVVEDLPRSSAVTSVPCCVGVPLHHLRELDLQPARQVQVLLGLHQVGDAALAGLGVDADDRLVRAAHVLRVDRQVRDGPDDVVDVLPCARGRGLQRRPGPS